MASNGEAFVVIVLVTNWLFGDAAIERRVRREAVALDAAGHDVAVLTDIRLGTKVPAGPLGGSSRTRVVSLRPRRRWLHTRTVTQELAFMTACHRALRRLAREHHIELVVSHSSTGLVGSMVVARRREIPAAYVVHSLVRDQRRVRANAYRLPSTALYWVVQDAALQSASAVIGVSQYMSTVAADLIGDGSRVTTLPTLVDTEVFRPLAGVSKDIDVLYVGRLSPEKGVRDLVAAARLLPRGIRTVVAGSGAERTYLEREGATTHADVRFHGYVHNDELPTLMSRSRLVVVPSLSESQGLVVLEAMACGVPVVATHVGGIPEVVEQGRSGWLVPSRNPQALAVKIVDVLERADLQRIGHQARQRAEQFAVEHFERQVVRLYEALAERGRRR